MQVSELMEGLLHTIRQRMPRVTIVVRNFIEYLERSVAKPRVANWTSFAGMRALPSWDITAMIVLCEPGTS